MKIKDGFLLREVAGNYVFIATGDEALDFGGIITVNEVGALIWKTLEKGATSEEIVDAVCAEYDIDRETADKDAKEFVKKLWDNNIIVQ